MNGTRDDETSLPAARTVAAGQLAVLVAVLLGVTSLVFLATLLSGTVLLLTHTSLAPYPAAFVSAFVGVAASSAVGLAGLRVYGEAKGRAALGAAED